ncbi:MAG: hypothetical protein IKT42_06940 [Clostridia bacterium]|nr:hypothetical protein [Clostridia bacterium]
MRVNEIKQGDCCGLCDIAICQNKNCPRWQKEYDREQYRAFCEDYGLIQALKHEDAGDRI